MMRTAKSFHCPDTPIKVACFNDVLKGGIGFGTQVQDPILSKQNYQHDQKCPIIVRGRSNIDPNHLAIRNMNGNLNDPTLIPTWKCKIVKNTLHKY